MFLKHCKRGSKLSLFSFPKSKNTDALLLWAGSWSPGPERLESGSLRGPSEIKTLAHKPLLFWAVWLWLRSNPRGKFFCVKTNHRGGFAMFVPSQKLSLLLWEEQRSWPWSERGLWLPTVQKGGGAQEKTLGHRAPPPVGGPAGSGR